MEWVEGAAGGVVRGQAALERAAGGVDRG